MCVSEINESAVGIDMTSPCQYPTPVGLEKGYIPDENMWTSSEINSLRGARFARLRGWKGTGSYSFTASCTCLMRSESAG